METAQITLAKVNAYGRAVLNKHRNYPHTLDDLPGLQPEAVVWVCA